MSQGVWWAVPAHVVAADEKLVEAFDAAIGEGERRAGTHLACRLGCTGCCIGLPVRCGAQTLPPRVLNLTAATEDEIATAMVEPDPGDHEGEPLAEGVRSGTVAAETIICAVLMGSEGARPS